MKFFKRIIIPFLFAGVIGFWLYLKLVGAYIPFKGDEVSNYVLIVVLSIAILIALSSVGSFSIRCKSCKKWDALRVISKKVIDKKSSHITKKMRVKNRMGNVIGTSEVAVPSTVYTYLIHKKCRFCEQVTEYTEWKNIEN